MDNKTLALDLGLTEYEFNKIKEELGREPNKTEIFLFSAMWSEHCGYTHSKKYLSRFPKSNSLFPDENAGGVKIGDYGIFFKVESHNHPSAVEPFQGAATGIGGIIRDILALGTRPIALLDSLNFGRIDKKQNSSKSKHICEGVVKGISVYGNSIGVPTVAGETNFDDAYEDSPLVNVMAVGLVNLNDIKTSAAKPDEYVVILGSHTGRDGIHGASFASKELSDDSKEDRPSIQIADPFTKKCLIEATLEILRSKNISACQDCGAAGILSSTSEMAYKGNCAMELYLDKVHLREENMQPWEIMLSESQERMIFTANRQGVKEIFEIAEKYELCASEFGITNKGTDYKLFWYGKEIASVPSDLLNNAPLYSLCEIEPDYIKEFEIKELTQSESVESVLYRLVGDSNFASKKWIFSQYDYKVGNRTSIEPQKAGSAGIWIKETGGVLGLCIDSNGQQVFLNPKEGSRNTVYEGFRNLVSSGFKPMGVTNCLNFGNPEKDEVGYQLVKSIDGIAKACEELSIPVVSGNVSLYNESDRNRVYPTPTIGMVGYADSYAKLILSEFNTYESIYLLGKQINQNSNIGGSLYQKLCFDFLGGKIDTIDENLEKKLMKTLFELRDSELIKGALDVSKGGLLGGLLTGLFNSGSGFEGNLITTQNSLVSLFGEITGRYLISTKNERAFEEVCKNNQVEFRKLGETNSSEKISFDNFNFDLKELRQIYENSIQKEIENV